MESNVSHDGLFGGANYCHQHHLLRHGYVTRGCILRISSSVALHVELIVSVIFAVVAGQSADQVDKMSTTVEEVVPLGRCRPNASDEILL